MVNASLTGSALALGDQRYCVAAWPCWAGHIPVCPGWWPHLPFFRNITLASLGLTFAWAAPAFGQTLSRDLQRALDPSKLNQGTPAEVQRDLRRLPDAEQIENTDPLDRRDFPGVAGDPLVQGDSLSPQRGRGEPRDPYASSRTRSDQRRRGPTEPADDTTGLRPGQLPDGQPINGQSPYGQQPDGLRPQQDGQPQEPTLAQELAGQEQPFDPAGQNNASEPAAIGPYDPLGVRVGSFLVFPQIGVEGVFNDNLLLSTTDSKSDHGLALTPSLTFRSQWSRHELTGGINGNYTFYNELTSEDDRAYDANLRGRIDVTRRTQIRAEADYATGQEERGSTDFPEGAAERPDFRTYGAAVQGDHRINRVRLRLRAEQATEDYDDSRLLNGAEENNDDRDYTERRLTGRIGYDLRPGVTAFVEASGNVRDFRQALDDNGLRNGSSGHQVQGGFSFELGSKLTGEVAAGYARQSPEEMSLRDIEGLVFNAGLVWAASALTTVRFDAASEISETTSASSAGSFVRTVGVSVEHALRRNVLLGAALGYEIESFADSNEEDKELVAALTGEYLLSRSAALTARFEHTDHTSNEPGQDYIENEVRVGLRLRR